MSSGGTTTEASGQELNIAFSTTNMNGYVQAAIDGLQKAAAPAKVKVFNANFDPTKQNKQIQDAVTSKQYDALVVIPTTGLSVPAIKAAVAAGIPTATMIAPPADAKTNAPVEGTLISTNQALGERGESLAKLTREACQNVDPCEAALMIGNKTLPFEQVIVEGFENGIKGSPNIKLAAVIEGEYDPQKSRKAAQDLLQSNPNIKVFAAGADLMAQGAQLAADSAGKSSDIKIIGLGASTQSCELVGNGKWLGTVVTVPRTEGELVGAALRAKIDKGADPENPTPDALKSKGTSDVISKENVDECPAQWRQ